MNDIFREVDEEYRHEQLLQFWHSNAKTIILVLVLAIIGAAGAGFWKSHQVTQRQNETYTLAHAFDDASVQRPADALATLRKAESIITGTRVTPLRFAIARALLLTGDKPGAIKLYDQIADSQAATSTERHLADIQSIGLQLSDGDPAKLSARLDKLAGDKSAWRFTAREFQVLLAMRQGDMQKAHDIAAALAADNHAPDGVHNRAMQLTAITGEGLAPSAPAVDDTVIEQPEAQ